MNNNPPRRVIGLDFGSSQSMVAVMEIGTNTEPEILPLDDGKTESKTLLAYDCNDESCLLAAGNEVQQRLKDKGSRDDFHVVRDFKRYLGGCLPNSNGKPAEPYCRAYLQYIYELLCKHYNVSNLSEKDFSTCLAYPATWNERQTDLLRKLARDVGFPDVQSISEPLAAVYSAQLEADAAFSNKSEYYLVIDFGGGTLDICIVEMGILGRFAKIISKSGNSELGGADFDKILRTKYLKTANINFSSLRRREQAYIYSECEQEKVRFSENIRNGALQYTCIFETPAMYKMSITRDEFFNWCHDAGLISKFNQCIWEAINGTDLDKSQIQRVVLTGGSSQWWFLKDILQAQDENGFGFDPERIFLTKQPHADVCRGCAIHAGYAENKQLIKGIWIKYRTGEHQNPDEGWSDFQQLRSPAEPSKEATRELKFLEKIKETKVFSPYQMEFKWYSGISESDLCEDSIDTGIVEVYARSNWPVFNKMKGIWDVIRTGGHEKYRDEYSLYMQMEETTAKLSYKFIMRDSACSAALKIRNTLGEEEAKKLPQGNEEIVDVEPGYISRCSFFGLFTRAMRKKK